MGKESFSSFDAQSISTTTSSTPTSTTKFQIRYKDWRARHGEVIDLATSTPIYTVEHRYRKPTFALNTPSGEIIATANSSQWTMKFDMTIASTGQDFELTPRHKLGCDVSYMSPAYGQTMSWEHQSRWGHIEYVLLDANALPIARFKGGSSWKCLPWGSFGEFEFVEGRVEREGQRDEVLATGMALAYKAVVNHQAATAAVVVPTS